MLGLHVIVFHVNVDGCHLKFMKQISLNKICGCHLMYRWHTVQSNAVSCLKFRQQANSNPSNGCYLILWLHKFDFMSEDCYLKFMQRTNQEQNVVVT